jgi:hypothetical protein
MTGLRTFVAAVGVLLAFLGGMLIISGHDNLTSSARDVDGYIMFDPATFGSASAAIVIEDIDVLKGRFLVHADDSGVPSWAIDDLDVRMQGDTDGPGALFMGIAASSAVDAYLDGVAYDEITDLELDVANVRDVVYTKHGGSGTPGAPGTETFWETSVEGPGPLTLDWTVEPGSWTAVVMNADASSGVTAELVFGAQASNIETIAWTKITIGLIALLAGGLTAFFAFRGRNRHSPSLPTESPGEPSGAQAEPANQTPAATS